MNILVADKLSDITIAALEAMGATLQIKPQLTADTLPAEIGDAEILIVRSTKVSAATLEAAPALSLVIRAGAGVNTIDIARAGELGIYVANCPGTNTDAVAELAIGLTISADRQIANATVDLRNGKWRKKAYGAARGLKTRTFGILGFGAIGQATARRAAALGMNVVAWSRSLTPEKANAAEVGFCATPLALAEIADVVSVHLASTVETKHLIGKAFLSQMKDGAILVNTSRGETVDTEALTEAVESKGLRVSLDVFEDEPTGGEATFENTKLAQVVTCSPHIGASTDQAAEAVGQAIVDIVQHYKSSGQAMNCVNMCDKSAAVVNLVVRHLNKVGVLADVLNTLKAASVNIEEMQNMIFDGGEAACCTLKLDTAPTPEVLNAIQLTPHVIQAALK